MATNAAELSRPSRVTAQGTTPPPCPEIPVYNQRSFNSKASGRAIRGSTPGTDRHEKLITTYDDTYSKPVVTLIDIPVFQRYMSLTYPLYPMDMDFGWRINEAANLATVGCLVSPSSAASVSPWSSLFSDLDRWTTLPHDWDGDDGRPPSPAATAAAHTFARLLKARGLAVPEHFIAGDGEISFDWSAGETTAAMNFFGDGSAAGYFQSDKGQPLLEIEATKIDLADLSGFFEALERFV